MKTLNNVLIKLARGGFTDRVLFLDNVPEELFYELRHPRVCIGEGQAQHYTDDRTQPKVMTLYPELRRSQTGDDGIIFDIENEQSKHRFLALDRYIKMQFPSNRVPAEPIIYAVDPSDPASPALELSKVPRVVLPALSPSESSDSVAGGATPALDVESIKRAAVAEYKDAENEKMRSKMQKAREARSIKTA